ncbi:MAG: ABC transporter ATP-binding protein/permease [Eubacterium sp.]|nr:ABC transporter ATP-binding protein/permease [Eubacterium sp.]
MKSPVLYILAIVFTTLQGISEIILPRLMGNIVNDGIMTQNLETVYSIGYKMLILTVVLGVSGYLAFIFINISVLRFANELRVHAYDKVTKMNYSTLRSLGGGSIITRLTGDTEKVVSIIKIMLDLVYKPMLLAVGGFLMIFSINLKFGLVFLSFIIIQVFIIVLFIKKSSPMFMKVQKSVDNINTKVQSVLHSMRLIRSSGTQGYEGNLFEEKSQGLYKRNIDVLTIMSMFNPIVMFIMNITIVVIVFMIGYQSGDNNSTIGNVMMSINYAEQILFSIMISSNLARTISEIKPSLSRILEILDKGSQAEQDMTKTINISEDGIEKLSLSDVSMSYVESREVLSKTCLVLNRGDKVAILGNTSSGKSTLAAIISGLETGNTGRVDIDGKDIREYEKNNLRRHIALVGAYNSGIYSGSYMDNLIVGRDYISREDAISAAKVARLDDFISSQDYGYDSLAYASGNTISGGQRQRLMIARALAGSPDILVLDDSTSSLDYATEKQIIDGIRENYKDMTLVLITERAGSAALCDRQLRLMEGGLK